MTTLMGELNAAEREADRLEILSEIHRVGFTLTLERLKFALGMNAAEALEEIVAYVNRRAA